MYKDSLGTIHKTYNDYVNSANGDKSYELVRSGKWKSEYEGWYEWENKRLYKDEERGRIVEGKIIK